MKSKMLWVMYFALVLALSRPVRSWAQAEIDPDHFDTPSVERAPAAAKTATPRHAAANSQGTFKLLNKVNYRGMSLTPGVYSISVRPSGKWELVTVTGQESAVRIRARVASQSGSDHPVGLVVERSGRERTLAGIRLSASGTTLSLQPGRQRNTTMVDPELVPISYLTRKGV